MSYSNRLNRLGDGNPSQDLNPNENNTQINNYTDYENQYNVDNSNYTQNNGYEQNNPYNPQSQYNQYPQYGQYPQQDQYSNNQYNQQYPQQNNSFMRNETFRPIINQVKRRCSTKNRIVAFLLDSILSNLPGGMIFYMWIFPNIKEVLQVSNYVGFDWSSNIGFLISNSLTIILINLFVYTLYFAVIPCYVLNGKSYGKKMMKLKVVPLLDDEEISLGMLIKREILGKFLSGLILCIGYLMGLGKEQLTLHDKIAKTKVIDDEEII